jgi:hypothetical protein
VGGGDVAWTLNGVPLGGTFELGFRASGNFSAATMRPTRMSSFKKSSKVAIRVLYAPARQPTARAHHVRGCSLLMASARRQPRIDYAFT